MYVQYCSSIMLHMQVQQPLRTSVDDKSPCYALSTRMYVHGVPSTVQLTTKFTKTLVSSGVPRHISKITRGLFSNA